MGLRGPVTSLPVTKGAERAKRVERGPGGGLAGLGAGGLWRRKGWETLGSQTPTKTGMVRKADGLTGLGRDGPLLDRR